MTANNTEETPNTETVASPEPAPDPYVTYDYAILRVVPRVERGEFMNAGVVVSCPARRYLEARYEVDATRLLALDPTVDLEAVEAHLEGVARVCRGGSAAGALGSLSQRERFHWLAAPRSALIQSSPVHTGRCQGDPALIVERLMDAMVRPPRSGRSAPNERAAEDGASPC